MTNLKRCDKMTEKDVSKDEMYKIQRKFAVNGFNSTWDYLDKAKLSDDEELEMLELAHSSRYHWSAIGQPKNFAIGDWQVSRAYAKINEGNLSLKYAKRCLKTTLDNKLEPNYLSAYEGIARAYAVLNDFKKASEYIAKAEQELTKVTDEEDRKIYAPQIAETKSMIKGFSNKSFEP